MAPPPSTSLSLDRNPAQPNYLLGLRGWLNPPTRFMYCLYSVFFSLRTALTLFPGTFWFLVVLEAPKAHHGLHGVQAAIFDNNVLFFVFVHWFRHRTCPTSASSSSRG